VRPAPGTELDLAIDSLAFGGNGVARMDGYVVFVRGGFPGDRVRARVTKSKRDYAEARTEEVLEAGPDRIEARADHPGAPWQVLPYERQLEEKQRQVAEALTRIGHFEDPPVLPIIAAVEQWRYRNKMEYSFGEGDDGRLLLGFHRPGRFDVIDDVTEDVLAPERIEAVRDAAREWLNDEGLSVWDRRDDSGFLRNLVVREGRRTGQLQARLVTSDGDFDADRFAGALPADSVLWTRAAGSAETTQGGDTELLRGEEWIEEHVCDLRFRISSEAFFQTNTEMAEQLYGAAAGLAGLSGGELVYDLFCGSGTIALVLAKRAREVHGIELVAEAIADATRNARLNGIENAHFEAGDVRLLMRPLIERTGKPDVVVVDPPRAGLSQKVVRRIIETEAQKIVYVSCNPTTLAPNARQMADAGYTLKAVQPVDMFPQTAHIESVALLSKD
jgi:23S rRNA (uracil1939-C5)-methyltransferase